LVRLDVDAGDVILDEERVGDLGRCIGAISHGFDDECLYLLCRERSLLVDIRKRESKLRDFSASTNPPILHRKELLLASSDRRRVSFAALTAELEARGLFADSHKIGLRRAWQERLDAAGVVIRDHRIIQERSVSTPHPRFGPAIRVERHRTAIARNRISSPMQMLARHGFLDSDGRSSTMAAAKETTSASSEKRGSAPGAGIPISSPISRSGQPTSSTWDS
jgi:hypothetical protein